MPNSRHSLHLFTTVVLGSLLALGACSDSAAKPTDGAVKDTQTSDSTTDPYAPSKLQRDKSTCPANFATTAPKAGRNADFEVEGQKRGFVLRLPDAAKFSGPRPVMVYFHGTNLSGDDINGFGWADTLLAKGVIVVGPDGNDNGSVWPEWDAMRNTGDEARKNLDLALYDKLIDCLAAHFEVDEKRLYVSGHSAGGIMTNRVLRERSASLAGGVVASGVYDLTGPVPQTKLDPMAIIVTFGGDNDEWGGQNNGKTVPTFNFAEQASIASKAYEDAPDVNQIYCRGDNVGHAWLSPADEMMADFLLAHPKGNPFNKDWKLVPLAANIKVKCAEDVVPFVPAVVVECKENTKPDCKTYCQHLADCAVENATVRPVLEPQLKALGFSGVDQSDCTGCVTQCETDATTGGSVDDQVLACLATESAKLTCTGGIEGALTLVKSVTPCCTGKTTSAVCGRICKTINENTVVKTFFPVCAAF